MRIGAIIIKMTIETTKKLTIIYTNDKILILFLKFHNYGMNKKLICNCIE